jgi:HEAT repeat protein
MESYRLQRWWWIAAILSLLLLIAAIIGLRRQAGGLRYEGQPAKKFVVDLLSTNQFGRPYVFAQMEPEAVVPGLIEILKRHHGLRYRAYRKLYGSVPRRVQRLLWVPRDYGQAAFQAIELLEHYGPRAKPAIPALIDELHATEDQQVGTRMTFPMTAGFVINALRSIDRDDPRVVQALVKFVQSKANDYYRVEAALTVAALTNPPAQLTNELWKLTATLPGKGLVPVLHKLNEREPAHFELCFAQLHNPHPFTRAVAAAALGQTRPAQNKTVAALLEATSDPADEVAKAALSPLLALAREEAITEDLRIRCVQRVLEKGYDDYQWSALERLQATGLPPRPFVPNLLALLSHQNPRVRGKAAESLGKTRLAEPVIVQALERIAEDEWGFVRDAVAQALVQLRQVEAQPAPAATSTTSTAAENP